jgi:acyl transferase domain-containing protein/NAD(P)H-dependent flavin oxidoreductase YrpB (nitropropane dioxygenase family)/NADP-dependent 3-hydroxy acid dehydrogenase YdfG
MARGRFEKLVYTPAGSQDVILAVAACRAGGIGVLNAELGFEADALSRGLDLLADQAHCEYGVRLSSLEDSLRPVLLESSGKGLGWLILDADVVPDCRAGVDRLRAEGVRVLAETARSVWPGDPLDEAVDGLVVKGNESGGFVGEGSSFILLQQWRRNTRLPLYLRGGVTPQVAAACEAVGAAGGVLDSQVLLLKESPFASHLTPLVENLSGNETVAVGDAEKGVYFRLLVRPGHLAAQEFSSCGAGKDENALREMVRGRIDWRNPEESLLPLGQDVCFAGPWRKQYAGLATLFDAIDSAVDGNLPISVESAPLSENSTLARSFGTTLPLVQGPMTRVSDNPDFAKAVSEGGAMPVMALALLRGERLRDLLRDTAEVLKGRPWGIGVLGFAPQKLLDEQLSSVRPYAPGLAILAGGRPDQAVKFEEAGIETFLHVPTAKLLPLFLNDGARRFIFEGRECGGHIGPLGAFVLWSTMVETLVEETDAGRVDGSDVQVLFAGGIHDAVSSAMVQVLAAPLLARGIQVGCLMGTAYLFTEEIVSTGATVEAFQREALACDQTVSLESGPGHASRCAYTPFARFFFEKRKELIDGGAPVGEIRETLDDLILGRLRIAAKASARAEASQEVTDCDEGYQRREGMYMLGQLATLRREKTTVAALHRNVTADANDLLRDRLLERTEAEVGAREAAPADIAIIGMSCLLPRAKEIDEYWENVLGKVDAVTEIPPHRWDWRLLYDEDRWAKDKVYSKWGAFVDDFEFDPTIYGMPPKSVTSVDPMQLMALEVARRALADAGYEEREFDRENTSVIVGASGGTGDVGMQYGLRAELPRFKGDLPREIADRLPQWTEDTFAGILINVVSGRISNRLGLEGANFTIDAACASSLAAVHQGMNALLSGQSNVVIAGGVDTVQGPFAYLCFSKTQALSPTGLCRTFDKSADGIVIAEGLAMLVMKRLADAERDGDRIYAVIKGVGAGSDGKAKCLTAPLPEGQLRAMRRAYAQAGFGPGTVGLFEAHGTGTVAGDTAELESTTRLLREAGGHPRQAAIGSVKTLIGHTKATAGVAGLVKAVLALHHRVLPPHYGAEDPNEVLRAPDSPLYIVNEPRPWLSLPGEPRRAAVSSFGFGGTNFHAVVEEYQAEYRPWLRGAVCRRRSAELLLWRTEDRRELLERLTSLGRELEAAGPVELRDLAYSLAREWKPGAETLAIVAADTDDLKTKLGAARRYLEGEEKKLPPGVYFGDKPDPKAKLAVLFSGQGSQYPDMLREPASHFQAPAESLGRADELLRDLFEARFGAHMTLSRFIFPRGAYSEEERAAAAAALSSTDVAQPALGAVEAGIWRLLRQLGLRADMLGGHSYGEFVALFAAGMIDFPTLMTLSESRGRFIVDAAAEAGSELGTMAAVQATREDVESVISGMDDVLVANHNAPDQCVISGTTSGIGQAAEKISAAGFDVREIPVAAAFHSPCVRPALAALSALIEKTPWRAGDTPVYSNTTAEPHADEPEGVRRVMTEHLVRPVEFVAEVEAMYRDGARVFLEVGPKSVLTRLVDRILGDRPHWAIAVDGYGGGIAGLLRALAQLICAGVPLDVLELFAGRDCLCADTARLDGLRRGTTPGPHVWLLNGSGVRRAHEPVRQIGVLKGDLKESQEDGPDAGSSVGAPRREYEGAKPHSARLEAKEGPEMGVRKTAPATGDGAVMAEYFETMRYFLETQERVMSRYMGAVPTARRTGLRSQSWTPAQPEREALRPEAQTLPAAPKENRDAPAGPVAETPPAGEENRPVAAESADAKSGVLDRSRMKEALLAIIEERTGYPPDMVGLDQDLEAELGVDSIKRVEIVGALLKELPQAYAEALGDDRGKLNTQSTLNGMLDILEGLELGGRVPLPFDSAETSDPAPATDHSFRHIIEPAIEEIDPLASRRLEQGLFLITGDDLGVGEELTSLLEKRGCRVQPLGPDLLRDEELLRKRCAALNGSEADIAGVVHMAQLGAEWFPADSPSRVWRSQLERNEKSLFTILNACVDGLRDGAVVLSASALGGYFGRDGRELSGLSLQGGAVGMLKSLREERPGLRVKAVDVDPEQDPGTLASALLAEIELAGGRQEVGYPGGRRTVFRTVAAQNAEAAVVSPSEVLDEVVVLATGGLRGVTAELLRELAVPGNTLLVTGRTALQEEEAEAEAEAEETRTLSTANALRGHFIAAVRAGRMKMTPAQVEGKVRSVLAERERLANMEDFRKRGANVRYFDVDVTDDAAMERLMADIKREYGDLNGVIHGAGVIEDALLRDKTSSGWSRVVDTKVCGLLQLQKHVGPPALKFFTVLSSVAGRYGNSGQTDYATANELMNRLCCQLHSLWKGRVNVKALCWGPWGPTTFGSGMVTAETEAKFAEKGVGLVGVESGRRLFAAELRMNGGNAVEVICGEGPWEEKEAALGRMEKAGQGECETIEPLLTDAGIEELPKGVQAVTFVLDESHAYLPDHRLDGTPVLPAAAALEIMAEAARLLWSGWHVVEVRDCRVLKGIEKKAASTRLSLLMKSATYGSSEGFEVNASILSDGEDGGQRLHYEAVLRLAQHLPESFAHRAPVHEEKRLSTSKAYGEWLAHGPRFRVIERIDGLSAAGARAVVRSTRPADWVAGPGAASMGWVFDPAVTDAATQMAWLWTRAFRDETALPSRFGRVVRYAEALPERLTMSFEKVDGDDPHAIRADVYFSDSGGRVLLMIEGLESVSSAELNRLGGTARDAISTSG